MHGSASMPAAREEAASKAPAAASKADEGAKSMSAYLSSYSSKSPVKPASTVSKGAVLGQSSTAQPGSAERPSGKSGKFTSNSYSSAGGSKGDRTAAPAPAVVSPEQRQLKEVFARYVARRDLLQHRVQEAQDRLLQVQKELAASKDRVAAAAGVAEETADLEAAVCRAANRVATMRDALSHNEQALSQRLTEQASRLKVLRRDAQAAATALRDAQLELQAARAGSDAAGRLSLSELQRQLRDAKAAQQQALQAAAAEHEQLLMRALEERGAKLAAAAQASEARVAVLMAEERELQRRTGELGQAIKKRRTEAAASVQRRRELTKQVQQLKSAIRASEDADTARLEALQREVKQLEGQVVAARQAGAELGPLAALAEAEAQAREEAQGKWQAELQRVREEGDKSLDEARDAGRRQYEELVKSMESRYVAEFESSLESIKRKQSKDAEQVEALRHRIEDVRAAIEAARADNVKVQKELQLAKARTGEAVEAKRARLAALKAVVRDVWAARQTKPEHVAAFLRKVQMATPYTAQVHKLYSEKVKELKAVAPLLQSITRRDVLSLRLSHIRRSMSELLAIVRGNIASHPRGPEVRSLQREFGAAAAELEAVTNSLIQDVQTYEAAHGRPFVYKGTRYLDTLKEEAAAAVAGGGTAPSSPSRSFGGSPGGRGGANPSFGSSWRSTSRTAQY